MKLVWLSILLCFQLIINGQEISYKDSMDHYQAEYIKKHEVVTGVDKQFFRFFDIDSSYKVTASVEKIKDGKWFMMETSGTIKKTFRVYAILHFTIHDTLVQLPIYQSQNLMQTAKYKDLLFLPFTDLTCGDESYASGRYIDFSLNDIVNNKLVIDFNTAYNPYCAYVSGKYNCPIPPLENQLPVTIRAGEKTFAKTH